MNEIITDREDLFWAKMAGRNVDISTMTPPVAASVREKLMLEVADKIARGGGGSSGGSGEKYLVNLTSEEIEDDGQTVTVWHATHDGEPVTVSEVIEQFNDGKYVVAATVIEQEKDGDIYVECPLVAGLWNPELNQIAIAMFSTTLQADSNELMSVTVMAVPDTDGDQQGDIWGVTYYTTDFYDYALQPYYIDLGSSAPTDWSEISYCWDKHIPVYTRLNGGEFKLSAFGYNQSIGAYEAQFTTIGALGDGMGVVGIMMSSAQGAGNDFRMVLVATPVLFSGDDDGSGHYSVSSGTTASDIYDKFHIGNPVYLLYNDGYAQCNIPMMTGRYTDETHFHFTFVGYNSSGDTVRIDFSNSLTGDLTIK